MGLSCNSLTGLFLRVILVGIAHMLIILNVSGHFLTTIFIFNVEMSFVYYQTPNTEVAEQLHIFSFIFIFSDFAGWNAVSNKYS